MRKKVVAGNWKMNKNHNEAKQFIDNMKGSIDTNNVDVVLCPPFIDLYTAIEIVKGTNIKIGAQNMHFEDSGAYTGEISVGMLKELGVEYVILGHSERRAYFHETDENVNKKAIKALENGIKPIICVGESLEEREDGITLELVAMQTKKTLKNISKEDMKNVIIAYEPIWAIGTGKVATKEQAEEVCLHIRKVLEGIYDKNTADCVIIQYGGSLNASNVKEIFDMPNIDGGLIGGASLKDDYIKMVNYNK